MKRRKFATRARVRKAVDAAIAVMSPINPPEHQESRFWDVVMMLEVIDWGTVPTPAIRAVLAAVVDHVPLKLLAGTGSRAEKKAMLGVALGHVEMAADIAREGSA